MRCPVFEGSNLIAYFEQFNKCTWRIEPNNVYNFIYRIRRIFKQKLGLF